MPLDLVIVKTTNGELLFGIEYSIFPIRLYYLNLQVITLWDSQTDVEKVVNIVNILREFDKNNILKRNAHCC